MPSFAGPVAPRSPSAQGWRSHDNLRAAACSVLALALISLSLHASRLDARQAWPVLLQQQHQQPLHPSLQPITPAVHPSVGSQAGHPSRGMHGRLRQQRLQLPAVAPLVRDHPPPPSRHPDWHASNESRPRTARPPQPPNPIDTTRLKSASRPRHPAPTHPATHPQLPATASHPSPAHPRPQAPDTQPPPQPHPAPAAASPTQDISPHSQPSHTAKSTQPPAASHTAKSTQPPAASHTAKSTQPPAASRPAKRTQPPAAPHANPPPTTPHSSPLPTGPPALPLNITAKPATPLQLPYPLWWFAPFFTGTGYGLEAQHYMLSLQQTGLVRPADLWISHHGDHLLPAYLETVPRTDLEQMYAMAGNAVYQASNRKAIMVCHSLPYNWAIRGQQPSSPLMSATCPATPQSRAYIVGRTMCEVDGIPHDMAYRCNAMDEVWVPSEWARAMFIKSGVEAEKLVVLPEGVDTIKFDPARYAPVQLPVGDLALGRPRQPGTAKRRPYVFLSTFKWESRKGYDVLLKAYLQEFKPDEAVELYIMTKPFGTSGRNLTRVVHDWVRAHLPAAASNCTQPRSPSPPSPSQAPTSPNTTTDSWAMDLTDPNQLEWAEPAPQLQLDPLPEPCLERPLPPLPSVYLITSHIPDEELPRYYRAADAFVLPSRGEGWGRPHVEAMSMGLPLISTNWSGMTAYLDASVGYPLEVESLIDADENNAAYFKGFKWAQPSVAHLQRLMRHVVDHPEEARARGRAARERMVTEYSSEAVGLKVVREVLRITRKLQAQGVPAANASPVSPRREPHSRLRAAPQLEPAAPRTVVDHWALDT